VTLLPWALVETERQLLPQIRRMEDVGLPVDLDYFKAFSDYLAYQLETERTAIHARGGPVNPNSADQVAAWLYDDLGVSPPRKRTKRGRGSTAEKYLQAARHRPATTRPQRQAVDQVLSYKELVTLKTRYVDPMPAWVGADGRLHARILYTRTDTGRLAAKDPNVLAFPKHSDLGLLVRRGFVAPPGRVLAEWDLHQIEIVMLAIDSGDERMLAEIRAGVDKHRATAAHILYRIPLNQVTPEQRFTAKAVNFGIVMGLTAKGLREQFDKQGSVHVDARGQRRAWTEADCQALLDAWARGYPQAAAYLERKHAEARRLGYVTDWRGRRRALPAVHSPHRQVAAEALRQAQATPIQAGAQELTKLWMLATWPRLEWLRAQGIYVELLLQVHDALLCELDAAAYDDVDAHIQAALGELPRLLAPVTCTGSGPARTWADC
jgi:DNA polymerase-1